jgi:3-hydroxymyristoyl/3-hydroxydecanoyl-(acyl carrier protein) dehydratase
MNEPFFTGHFPGHPVFPGVLILETMAQTGCILLVNSSPGKLAYFMQINNAKFRKTVLPGDQMVIEAEMVSKKSKVASFAAKVYVDNYLVAEADFMAAIIDRDVEYT